MKLANPRTIQQDLAEQRRVDIDNGIKLARQVDSLREKLQVEEQRQALYEQGVTQGLRDKIESLKETISLKELEIEQLEKKKAELLKPVTIKWDEVNAKEKELTKTKEDLDKLRESLTDFKLQLDTREKEIAQEEERIAELRKEITIQSDKVANASLQAQNTLLNARDEEKRILNIARIKEGNAVKKETELKIRENNILSRESQLEIEEQNIINEKIRLADQRATLERAMSKYKKA